MSRRTPDRRKRSKAQIVWKRWGDWRKVALAGATALVVAILLIFPLLPDQVRVTLHAPAPRDIVAPRTVSFTDYSATQALKQAVAQQVPRSYSWILGADTDARRSVTEFFDEAEALQRSTEPFEQRVRQLQKRGPNYPAALSQAALLMSPEDLGEAKGHAVQLVDNMMRQPVPPDAVDTNKVASRARARTLTIAPEQRMLVGDVVSANLVPNQVENQEETEAARRRERDRVPLQVKTIRRGDLVLQKGEKVTTNHIAQLEALGLVRQRVHTVTAVSLALLGFGLVGVFCLYLYQFHPALLRSFGSLLLVALVVCGCLLLFRGASTGFGMRFSGDQLGFMAMSSSALGAMLIAALLCPQVAVFVGVALALLTSVMVGAELRFAILSIVSSLVGVQAVTTIRNRAGILRAVAILAGANALTSLVANGVTNSALPEDMGPNVAWAVGGGFTSVMLFVLFAAWLERPFRLTTPLTLLELSDPTHPLLRRLSLEAPGTYSHSISVGNLSEAAAEAIGADGLFCRVASYYHDVGKVIRPHFFIENQSSDNRHNEINPSLSSLIVTSHVKDGVELAEEYRLPPPIVAIIREHHGTCLIKYFYHRAVTEGEDSSPSLEYQFRYEGPRPQTKESGIIMLADSVEAASRTMEKPTPGRIRDLIERIVRDRLSDGQLDECELTFKDLEKIITSLTRSLASMLHARVEYPSTDTGQLRRLAEGNRQEAAARRKALADTPETASGAFGRGPRN